MNLSKKQKIMSRKPFIGGNWKSNGTKSSITELVTILNTNKTTNVEVVVAPVFIHLDYVKGLLKNEIQIAAQNCSLTSNGAFTGEVSADQLVDFGIPWVILGHSERRKLYNESNSDVAKKVSYALSKGLKVIACVGENLTERKSNNTLNVLKAQIDAILDMKVDWKDIVIAYEPVWAIGTGVVATPEQAQEAHTFIRGYLKNKVSPALSESIRIIYGGSVNASNCKDLKKQDSIDGFLVGGASLKNEFLDIIACYSCKSSLNSKL